jgi:class 3 adenylate cyclase
MPEKPQRKPQAKKNVESSLAEVQQEIARIYKPFDSDLVSRSLAASMPSTSALADAVKSISSSSHMWADIAKSLDWSKSVRLHSEALRAMNISSAIQRQNEVLRAVDWDVEKLRNVLPSPVQASKSDEDADNGLESEIRRLTEEIEAQGAALTAGEVDRSHLQKLIAERDENIALLKVKLRLAFLLHQVHPAAQSLLEADNSFRDNFEAEDCWGFVMSVDIRRSSELMLKARRPKQYAEFVSQLTQQLTKEVLESFGVFDKFTGDGILAFFPDFYSGKDAGFHAASAALRCHQIFENHYREHRSSFISILQDTGLGIGIDYGKLHLVQVSGALTVVGPPVVYACRLGGAPAGSTYINQQAYEELSNKYGNYLHFEETGLDLKHEGSILAYRVTATAKSFDPQQPDWINSSNRGDETKDG